MSNRKCVQKLSKNKKLFKMTYKYPKSLKKMQNKNELLRCVYY